MENPAEISGPQHAPFPGVLDEAVDFSLHVNSQNNGYSLSQPPLTLALAT